MTETLLEAFGLLFAVAALACFVVAAWAVSWIVGTLALGGAFAVIGAVLVVLANTRKPKLAVEVRP